MRKVKTMVADTTVAHPRSRAFERAEAHHGWITRLWEWLLAAIEPVPAEDWTEPETETYAAEAEAAPAPRQPAPRPVHPPFAGQPAYCTHVLDRMLHRLIELRADPNLTPIQALEAMRPLNEELSDYARQQHLQQQRMQRNQDAAAAQAVLLEEAARRGAGEEVAAQAAAGITGRAVHVADPTPTQQIPVITEDTPDPRTVAQPRDINPGDPEPATTPVHADDETPAPVPAAPELTEEPAATPAAPIEPDHAWTETVPQATRSAGAAL